MPRDDEKKRPRSAQRDAARDLTPGTRLTVQEGRDRLHQLTKAFRSFEEPSDVLLSRAVEIGPYRKGGAVLVPEIDARRAVERLGQAEAEIEELEDQLEVVGLLFLAEERLGRQTPTGDLIPVEELARELGMEKPLPE